LFKGFYNVFDKAIQVISPCLVMFYSNFDSIGDTGDFDFMG
jgi:hypothetical protein